MTDASEFTRLLPEEKNLAPMFQDLNRLAASVNRQLQQSSILSRYSIRHKSFVIDLNFTTDDLEFTRELEIRTLKRDLIVKNFTNSEILFIKPFETTRSFFLMPKLDMDSGMVALTYAFWLNIALLCGAGLMIVVSGIMFFFGYDVTHILLDFTRMAKTIHRIKFVNVNQTPLVEFFLGSVYNIYQTSLDKPRDEIDKY